MSTVSRQVDRADLVLVPLAVVLGASIGWIDSRPGYDATGLTVTALLAASTVIACLSGRRPWLWALLIGICTPLLELGQPGGAASLAALVVSAVGALMGFGLRWVLRRDQGPDVPPP